MTTHDTIARPAHSPRKARKLCGIALTAILAVAFAAAHARAEEPSGGLFDPDRFAANLKYTGLSYHPGGGENIEHYKRSLDSRDYWVVLVGAEADGDWMVNRFVYIRAATSLYQDCSELWAGYYHLGFRANADLGDKVALRIGIGPTLIWRQNWFGRVKGYTKDSFFGPATPGEFQSKFIWYGGDIEAEWKLWRHASLVYSVIPGFPEVVTSSVGARYRF